MERYTVNMEDGMGVKMLARAKKLKAVKKSDGEPSIPKYIERLILEDCGVRK